MSETPSYVKVLNAIAVGERRGHALFDAWAATTSDAELRQTLKSVGANGVHSIDEFRAAFLQRNGEEDAAARVEGRFGDGGDLVSQRGEEPNARSQASPDQNEGAHCSRSQDPRRVRGAGSLARPHRSARSLMRVGVLGAGVMGAGIAQVLAAAGDEVVCYDIDATALDKTELRAAQRSNLFIGIWSALLATLPEEAWDEASQLQ